MRKTPLYMLISALALLVLTACSTQVSAQPAAPETAVTAAPETPAQPQASFGDPFAYCDSVGTIDAPDSRYTGEAVPDSVIDGFKKAADLEASTMPLDMFKKTTIWRCMDKQVYACNFGANLPCSSKANTDKTPTQAMNDFCSQNPDSDVIPMSVTGHSTIYSWRCEKGSPELLDQIDKVDSAGFLERIWYPIQASQ